MSILDESPAPALRSPELSGGLGSPSVLSTPPKPKPHLRSFGDAKEVRRLTFHNVLKAAREMPPATNKDYTLRLDDVDYDGPEDFSYADQKQAILGGQTLTRKLRGTWRLIHNETGQVVDQKKTTIARVPYFTDRGTAIINGSDRTIGNQLRLLAGSFARQKENGELEAHVNVMPGNGASHRYYLDPEKGTFHIKLGQARLPLLPLVRALGAQDAQLREAWGSPILAANYQHSDPSTINKLYDRLVKGRRDDLPEDRPQAVAEAMRQMRLDPEVTKRTLGTPYDRLDLDAILATTKKLLAVSRGEQEVDDRDHLAYQSVLGPEDLIAERIAKDAGRVRQGLLWKATFAKSLKGIGPGALDKQVMSGILHSGLGQTPEEVNPLEVFDRQTHVTRMGEGGIGSLDAVPEEARAVQPSHLGFIDPLRTPESFRAGVDVFLANAVKKGDDGRLYAPFKNPRTGQTDYLSPQDIADETIAFPNSLNTPGKRVIAMQGGRLKIVPKRDVTLVVPYFEDAFSPLGNLVPMKSAMKGQRVAMAGRMITQALPLVGAESPLVQSALSQDANRSFDEEYGRHAGAVHAPQAGQVLSVSPGGIDVQYADGTRQTHQLYDNFAYNRKTPLHNTPLVKPGDMVQPGQILAKSNYTDDQGAVALGRNLRTGYIPFRGQNFEDAVVISESAAKHLTSEHMYQHGLQKADGMKLGKAAYMGIFGGKYNQQQLATLDDDGVVKPGTTVDYGHPLVVGAQPRVDAHNRIHRRGESGFSDLTQTWEHHSPGVVTDVLKTPQGITVFVKSTAVTQVGDKLSGRYGDKGVVSAVIPDAEMPHDAQGRPLELLLNPLSIISRTNPAQKFELALGKLAAMTGQKYKVQDFANIRDLAQFTLGELQRHGLQDVNETVTDPETGQAIPNVAVGSRYIMKLQHMAEGKAQARGTGGYTASGAPSKGGYGGSKRISLLDINALLSHGATAVLRDSNVVRGQRNEEFWLPFLQGNSPPNPKVPEEYRKFLAELKASGINAVEDSGKLHIMALTDADVDQLAGDRRITSSDTVRLDKGLEPISGGLFDKGLTGGHHGQRWAAIDLHEPMPSPVMEEPIRRLLKLTENQFRDVLAGRKELRTGTGPAGLRRALESLNLPGEIDRARIEIAGGRKTVRDDAVRRLRYLKAAERLGMHPGQWMLSKAPVLPPAFRPISVMSDSQLPLVSDANYLYKELIDANHNLRDLSQEVSDVGEERLAVYDALKSVTGLGQPSHPKLVEKNVQGLLAKIFGSSPKMGTVQRRLLSSTTDLVGRGVIVPNPDLDMDHVGLPENHAWEVYKNFIVRRLKRQGMPVVQALQHVDDRTPLAKQALLAEMQHRPVIVNRAPVLHRFGIQAFFPQLTQGDTLQVSPLIVKGFGADFDGDTMQYHVPVLEEARLEAIERMLPSRNLFSPADFHTPMHSPTQEYTGGLYHLSTARNERRAPRVFGTVGDALKAIRNGEVSPDTRVEILDDTR